MAEVIQDCFYRAVMTASDVLNRKFDEGARDKLLTIIKENNCYPPDRWEDIPELLQSLHPFQVFGLEGEEKYTVSPGEPVTVGRRTALVTNPDDGHAVFGYANDQMFWGGVGLVIVFK